MTKSQHTQTNMSTPERYCSTLQRTHSELYSENWQAEHFSKTLIIVIRFNLVQFSPSSPLNFLCKLHVPSMFWAVVFYFTQFGVQLLVEEFRDSSFEYCGTKLSLVQFLKKKERKRKKHTYFFIKMLTLNTNPNNPYKTVDQVLLVPELLSCPGTSWRQIAHESSSMDEYCWPGLSSVW